MPGERRDKYVLRVNEENWARIMAWKYDLKLQNINDVVTTMIALIDDVHAEDRERHEALMMTIEKRGI
jgi:pantothenate kinase